LGGNLYKKRLAFGGKGKRGVLILIIAFKQKEKTFFIYDFAKNKNNNITKKEIRALKKLTKIYLTYDDRQTQKAIEIKEFIEIFSLPTQNVNTPI